MVLPVKKLIDEKFLAKSFCKIRVYNILKLETWRRFPFSLPRVTTQNVLTLSNYNYSFLMEFGMYRADYKTEIPERSVRDNHVPARLLFAVILFCLYGPGVGMMLSSV